MLLSIFTPTHDPHYLVEAYQSLEIQEHTEWEWIVGLNGGAQLPSDPCFQDPRVKVRNLATATSNIGELKKACCQYAAGEVLVELDHDDVLWPDVLTHIARCADKGADFIYSDAASYDTIGQHPVCYSFEHGWEAYSVHLYGRELLAIRNFPITARSLCDIFYSPDHVRCWRRSFYEKIGGHDSSLAVGDDHDLICRSYIKGGKFAHTGTVGYVYRFHPDNTVKARNAAIQAQNAENRGKYIHQLIDKWCVNHGLGYADLEKVEWMDNRPVLNGLTPGSVGCIRAYNVLHWVPQDDVPAVIEECYDVLAPGGWLCCRVPSTNGPAAFVPNARSHWNMLTFEYFCYKDKALCIQPFRGRFQRVQCYEAYVDPDRDAAFNRVSVWGDLCAIKGQRQPGQVFI